MKNVNIKAFLGMIVWAEGGGYDFMYGAIKGKKNDKWRFTDYSTHPGPGRDHHTTAAGAYQITKGTWEDHGIKMMGLSDFSPHTQDLIAVDVLRRMKATDALVNSNFLGAMQRASYPWASLEQGPGIGNRYPKQPYRKYQDCLAKYKELGGEAK
ncbi:paar repeat-containing protein [Aquitalea sp. LB_tupeE]|nr:paar repeat-containing protein [Aquitalea sp. LB_tupeE]